MKKYKIKNYEMIGIIIAIIAIFTIYFSGIQLFSISPINCFNTPSVCGIPNPPITISNVNFNTALESVTSFYNANFNSTGTASYVSGAGENNSEYWYSVTTLVYQTNYYLAGANGPGASIDTNGAFVYDFQYNLVFPRNTSNVTQVDMALNYLNNTEKPQMVGSTNGRLNASLTGYINQNLIDAFPVQCYSNVNGVITIITTCLFYNEPVGNLNSGLSQYIYNPISLNANLNQNIEYLKLLAELDTTIKPTTTVNTTTVTTVPTTIPPPPTPPQFNIGQLLNSILSAITGFLKTIGL